MSHIVLIVADEMDRQEIVGRLHHLHQLVQLRNPAALSHLKDRHVDIVVYEMSPTAGDHRALIDFLDLSAARLVVRLSPSQSASQAVFALSTFVPSLGVALRTCSGLHYSTADFSRAIADPDGGPTGPSLLRLAATAIPRGACPFLLVAIVLGRTRVTGAQYAATLRLAPRTVQDALAKFNLPSPHRLLLWGQTLWAVWRMQQWEMSCKQTAVAGGFRPSSMCRTLRATTGRTPRELQSMVKWTALLDEFAHEIAPLPSALLLPSSMQVSISSLSGRSDDPGGFATEAHH